MPNKPFDYTIINPLERPTSTDLNQMQGQAHSDVRALASALFGTGSTPTDGFVGNSFKVSATSPVSSSISVAAGVAFQTGVAESNIGSIAGLNDAYPYKVLYTDERAIDVLANAPAPTTAGYKRRDLIEIRARSESERLANQQSKGIYNVTNNSFLPGTVYKTLSSDLTAEVQFVPPAGTVTGTVVYKIGVEGNYPTWEDAPVPSTDPGYMAIAVVRVQEGDTSIAASRIEDDRALLSINSSIGAEGGVAYSDGNNLAFTEAGSVGQILVQGALNQPFWLDNAPAYRFLRSNGTTALPSWAETIPVENGGTERTSLTANALLVGNGTSPVNFLSPGLAGQVVVSDGTSWISSPSASRRATSLTSTFTTTSETWVEIPGLAINDVETRVGNIVVGLQPRATGDFPQFYFYSGITGGTGCRIRIRLTRDGAASIYDFVFSYRARIADIEYGPDSFPIINFSCFTGTYQIKFYAQMFFYDTGAGITLNNIDSYAYQG